MARELLIKIGDVYGFLTVMAQGPYKATGKKKIVNRATWLCKCQCGNEVCVLGCNLRRPNSKKQNTTSCGCRHKNSIKYNFTDLVGKKFGQLTVVKRLSEMTKTRGCLWECKCD